MSDIPSSSWCTNWEAYNTPRLWSMVAAEDNPEAWKQVIAWREVSDAVDAHLARLKQARETLEAAWPTGQSEASRAFVTRLNTLITRMEGARQEASSTSTALDHILQALRQAKQNIEPLWKQYRDKNEDVVPAWWDNAEEELDAQARAHMIHAEQVVQQYVPGIQVPIPYKFEPPRSRRERGDELPSGDNSPGLQESGDFYQSAVDLPHHPPPAMSTGAMQAVGNHGSLFAPHAPGTSQGDIHPQDSSGRLPSRPSVGDGRLPSRPELSEVVSLPPSMPGPTQSPPLISTGGSAVPGSLLPPSLIPGLGGGASVIGGKYAVGGALRPFGRVVSSALPSGGVIGTPSAVEPNPGSVVGARGARPANPLLPPWLSNEPQSGLATGIPSGGGRGRVGETEQGQRLEPDNLWSVARGVDPVIMPPRREVSYDPGRGIIGHDR